MPKIAITATPARPRVAPLLLCGDIPGAFHIAAALGCQGVELHFARASDLDLALVKRLMSEYRQAVPTLGTGMAAAEGLTFADPDPAIRDRAVERVRGHIEFAAETGSAVTIGFLSGKLGNVEGDVRITRRSQALESLARVCALAAPLGVTILLEPLNRYECDYISTLADGARVAADIGAPNLKLLADTFHMNIEEADVAASIRTAGALVGHVHLADSNREAPGHGHLDIGAVLGALDAIGYRGFLSFEVFPLPDAATAIRDGIQAIGKKKIAAAV